MKYPQIQALVPKGEHFDESASLNEGGYLSTGHLSAIENDLATNTQALEQANAMIETHANSIADLNATIATMQTAADTAIANAATQTARIANLEAEVKELGSKPSGTGTTVTTAADAPPPAATSTSKLPKWDSEDHPANKMADQVVRRKKK